MRRLALALAVLAAPAWSQDMATAPGARLRILDKLTGAVQDVTLANDQSTTIGRVTVLVNECRYPADKQTAEAEVHLTVIDASAKDPVFNGWMVASSPALSALDHPRYDVWVLRCDVGELALPEAPAEEPVPEETPPTDG
jgi:hypothetical protein